jgi:hypothetical protein
LKIFTRSHSLNLRTALNVLFLQLHLPISEQTLM